MTVATQGARKYYAGNGVTTAFAFPYKIVAAADIRVYSKDVNEVETVVTAFTVSNPPFDSGCTVTITPAPVANTVVIIVSDPDGTQGADYLMNDSFPASTTESAFDKSMIYGQRVRDIASRAIRQRDSDSDSTLLLPMQNSRALHLLGFDIGGLPTVGPLTSAVAAVIANLGPIFSSANLQAVTTIAALKAIASTPLVEGQMAAVGGFSVAGDGGFIYRWDDTSAAADNGGTIIQSNDAPATGRWKWIAGDPPRTPAEIAAGVTPTSYAYPSGYAVRYGFSSSASAATNATALQNAINVADVEVVLPAGTFDYSTGLTIDRAIKFTGAGARAGSAGGGSATYLNYTGASGVAITLVGSTAEGKENIHLRDFSLTGTANADGGILVGTSVFVTKSSIKNVHIKAFSKVNTYGLKPALCLETLFENVYCQDNYDGIVIAGVNTTLNFTNCWSRTSVRYGWNINDCLGSVFVNCLAEGNQNVGLRIFGGNGTIADLVFIKWHSEINQLGAGAAPVTIDASAGTGPSYITFIGGEIGDHVGNVSYSIANCQYVVWHNPEITTYSPGWITCTSATVNCHFHVANDSTFGETITGNAQGRVAVHGQPPNLHWLTETFAAGNYTASSGLWTLTSPDETTRNYKRSGKDASISLYLVATTVSATPAYLFMALPDSMQSKKEIRIPFTYSEDGGTTTGTGVALLQAASNQLAFAKNLAGSVNWATTANLTVISFAATFEIV